VLHGAGGNESAWSGVTKATYGQNLEENLRALHQKLRQMSYRPQPVRRVEIPKEDGTIRLLGISCIEDKIVQEMTRRILEAIYEPVFIKTSYGYRSGKSCHDALRQLNQEVMSQPVDRGPRSSSVFDTMPHLEILTLLAADQGQEISAIGSANAESRVQTPGGLCRVNWEVRKARLSPRCWRIYSWICSTNGLWPWWDSTAEDTVLIRYAR